MKTLKIKEWWKSFGDMRYLKMYADVGHISPQSTARQVAFMKNIFVRKRVRKILDLGCGYGRHTVLLALAGYDVTGIDYSDFFIKLAKKEAAKQKADVVWIKQDMRKLDFRNMFDAVINMYTTFGYFADEAGNNNVLKNISRSLKSGGIFLFDLTNTMRLMTRLLCKGDVIPKTGSLIFNRNIKLSNGLHITLKQEIDSITMRWIITRTWRENDKKYSHQSNIRLYFLPEITHLLEENGLEVTRVWGDFDGSKYTSRSKRMLILAKKSDASGCV